MNTQKTLQKFTQKFTQKNTQQCKKCVNYTGVYTTVKICVIFFRTCIVF